MADLYHIVVWVMDEYLQNTCISALPLGLIRFHCTVAKPVTTMACMAAQVKLKRVALGSPVTQIMVCDVPASL